MKRLAIHGCTCYLLLIGFLHTGNLAAAEPVPLFNSHEVLELNLSVDFNALCRPREVDNCQYAPTTLTYTGAQGVTHSVPVSLRIRGGWRSRRKHCRVPPLFVQFAPAATAGTPFAGQQLLPLTTHCRSTREIGRDSAPGKEYEQYTLREYLGYRLFNLLGDKSLRVRLLHITYSDPANPGNTLTRYAFFTEHFEAMAARLGATIPPRNMFDHEKIDLQAFDNVAMFNFMIGNTDSSVARERNIVLGLMPGGQQFPVPFDLDMSGLVNAEYAGVSPHLSLRNVRQRLYLGFCHPDTDWDALFARFQQRKTRMLGLLAEIPGLSSSSSRKSRSYLERFFAILDSPRKRQRSIIDACLQWPPPPDDHTTPPENLRAALTLAPRLGAGK